MIAKDDISYQIWTKRSGYCVYLYAELINKSPGAVDAKIPFVVHDGYDRLKSHGSLVFANVKAGETTRERHLLYFHGDGLRNASVSDIILYEGGYLKPHRKPMSADASGKYLVSTRTTWLLLGFSIVVMLYTLVHAAIVSAGAENAPTSLRHNYAAHKATRFAN